MISNKSVLLSIIRINSDSQRLVISEWRSRLMSLAKNFISRILLMSVFTFHPFLQTQMREVIWVEFSNESPLLDTLQFKWKTRSVEKKTNKIECKTRTKPNKNKPKSITLMEYDHSYVSISINRQATRKKSCWARLLP